MSEEIYTILKTSENPPDRYDAAEKLLNSGDYSPGAIEAFARGMLDSDLGVKDICSRALTNAPKEAASLVASTIAPLIKSEIIEVRNLAGDILNNLGTAAVEHILPYFDDDDAHDRQFAVDIIRNIGDVSVLPKLYQRLDDTNENVKNSAIEAIGSIRSADSIDILTQLYEKEEDLKPTIIESIGKIGGALAQDFLISKLRNEEDYFLQSACIDALALGGEDPTICETLLSELPHSPYEMQPILLKTIFAIAFRQEITIKLSPELRPVAQRSLTDDDPDIRAAGLIALGEEYYEDDVDGLVEEVLRDNPETQQQILYILLSNSSAKTVERFFNRFCTFSNPDGTDLEFLSFIPVFWEHTKEENKPAVVNTMMNLVYSKPKGYSAEIIEILIKSDRDLVLNKMQDILENGKNDQIDDMLDNLSFVRLHELDATLKKLAETKPQFKSKIDELLK